MNTTIDDIVATIGQVLLGKEEQVKLAVACLLARGHLLIEDLPGMGKTTLAQCLAKVLGLDYDRIQFTSDLLPADILGVAIFDRNASRFDFHPGPIFTQVLLADEINRTTPKTQSALLEAMEEGQVTVEGASRTLPEPFFVIATQNPITQAGTHPLPESQLDRFLLRVSLGYPSQASERQLFEGVDPRKRLLEMQSLISNAELLAMQEQAAAVQATGQLLDYLQRLVDFTRHDDTFSYGLSPRGAVAWLKAAKAWALVNNREHVLPDDLQKVAVSVVGHRVRSAQGLPGGQNIALIQRLLSSVDVLK